MARRGVTRFSELERQAMIRGLCEQIDELRAVNARDDTPNAERAENNRRIHEYLIALQRYQSGELWR